MNPYFGSNFFQFFHLLALRLWLAVKGDLARADLASDEVQLLVLGGVALSGSLVGVLLVLRKKTMLANSLSHTILLGLVLAFLLFKGAGMNLKILLVAAFLSAVLTAFCTEFLRRVVRLQEDASIGLVFTTLFALGVTGVTLFARNTHLAVEAVMGNVDALHVDDLKMVGWVALVNLALIALFFKEWKVTTFDEGLAKTLGFAPLFFTILLLFQTSLSLVGSFRAVGVLLVLAFLVIPPLCARLLTNRLGYIFFLAPLLGSGCALLGVALSRHLLSVYHLPLSTAGIVVLMLGALYATLLALTLTKKKAIIAS